MIRIDGYWFYQVGAALRQVTNRVYEPGVKRKDIRYALSNAQQWVDNLLSQTLFRFKTLVPKGREVQQLLHGYVEAFNAMTLANASIRLTKHWRCMERFTPS